jgi:outer membrane receptor protein involved in Fe transport
LIAGISNLTDEKYYDRVFANGIETRAAPLRLRWSVPGILTKAGADENGES